MSVSIEVSFRRDILRLLLAHYASPHTKFLTVPEPMLPNKPRGVPRVDDRRVLNGIFWVLRSGAPWRDLPESYGLRRLATIASFAGGGLAFGTGSWRRWPTLMIRRCR